MYKTGFYYLWNGSVEWYVQVREIEGGWEWREISNCYEFNPEGIKTWTKQMNGATFHSANRPIEFSKLPESIRKALSFEAMGLEQEKEHGR